MEVFNMTAVFMLVVGIGLGLIVAGVATGHVPKNNPGNIVKSKVDWMDSVDCAGRFACFTTRLSGLRALVVNLRTYIYVHKLDNIERIITRWAPPHENPTRAYINFVSARVGIRPTASLKTALHISDLVEAIIAFEDSGIKYTRSEIETQVVITFNIQR